MSVLRDTVDTLLAPGKGLLAADESLPSIANRFRAIGLDSTETARRGYRAMLFETPGIENHISGVILFDETARQASDGGTLFPRYLSERGIVSGIKVDRGTKLFSGQETVTEGLDNLEKRLEEYRGLGLRFAKWRAVFRIGAGMPSMRAIQLNTRDLARYAYACQHADIVPIVEPEVLMDGDHDIGTAARITENVLQSTFRELFSSGVNMQGMLLKPNMVLPGKAYPHQADVTATVIASTTVDVLRNAVPASVPGIVFLSGGQSEKAVNENLGHIVGEHEVPWTTTFSFGRSLQTTALKTWAGDPARVKQAQAEFLRSATFAGRAASGLV